MRFTLATLLTLSVLTAPAFATDDGETVFKQACASCHTGGIGGWMSGGPDIDDKQKWQPLLAKGVEALTFATINGIGEMPPRGKCTTCTDEQIGAAVEYIVQEVQ